MGKHRLAFVAFDSAKNKHAVAIADGGRGAEVRYLGEIVNSPDAVRKLVAKLTRQYERLHFCYEAGPTGYGLHRQLTELGHVCDVVAPTMIPKRSGDRVKTNAGIPWRWSSCCVLGNCAQSGFRTGSTRRYEI